VRWDEGGPDPLDGLAFFPLDDPVPHWHAVGYGLSREHGHELSTRVARDPGELEPPGWVFSWLQNLARYVADTGNALRPGDQMPANGPIREDHDTTLTAMLFRRDPVLDPLVEPDVVQVVGVTDDELRAKRAWQFEAMMALLERELGPELVVDLDRPSVLAQPEVAAEAREGARRDGSSTTRIACERVEVRLDPPSLAVDALVAQDLGLLLAARLAHGRRLDLSDDDGNIVHLFPGDEVALEEADAGHVRIDLPPAALRWLDGELEPRAGTYAPPELAPLTLEVRAIDITDRDGAVTARLG